MYIDPEFFGIGRTHFNAAGIFRTRGRGASAATFPPRPFPRRCAPRHPARTSDRNQSLVAARARYPLHPRDFALEGLNRAARQRQRQHANETRAAILSALLRARRHALSIAARKSFFGPAQRAENTPGLSADAEDFEAESSASAGRPEACRRRPRFQDGVAHERQFGLLRLRQTQLPAETAARPRGARSALISRTLPGLWEATTRRSAESCGKRLAMMLV